MMRVTAGAFVAWKSKLATPSVYDNWLFLRRVADKNFNEIVAETCISINREGMLR